MGIQELIPSTSPLAPAQGTHAMKLAVTVVTRLGGCSPVKWFSVSARPDFFGVAKHVCGGAHI